MVIKADKGEFERLEDQVSDGNQYIKLIGVLNKGVWSRSAGELVNDNIGENAVRFLALLLNKLEDTANSRGKYRLQDWLALELPTEVQPKSVSR